MKKQILSLGKGLSKTEQKEVKGGFELVIDDGCVPNGDVCYEGYNNPNTCCSGTCNRGSGNWGVCA